MTHTTIKHTTNTTSDYIRAECEGCVCKVDYREGWKDTLRQWKKGVHLGSGSKLTLYRVKNCLVGKPYISTIQ